MKAKRMLALLLAALLLVSLFAVAAFATPSKPYGTYGVSVSNGLFKDTATASISRCTCMPVDNYLKAGIQVQYEKDGGYYWIPSDATVYVKSATNTEGVSESIEQKNIVYVHGQFKARCGSGAEKSYWDSTTN